MKRIFDVAVAATLLIPAVPVMLGLAVLIRLESSGPALFRQARRGYARETFTIWKLRTVKVGRAASDAAEPTRLGRLLRASSLDELPQLFNVIGGSMSLVGPRPHATAEDDMLSEQLPSYAGRYCVRPGLTGLAQISGFRGPMTSRADAAGRLACDLDYCARASLALDVVILARTMPLLWGERQPR